jgi:hypothetical protein
VLISINLEIFGGLIKLKISPTLERKRSEEVKFDKEEMKSDYHFPVK